MSRRVLKWDVPVDDETHEIGAGPVLMVACQNTVDVVQVWTDESSPTLDGRPRFVRVFGTGHEVPVLWDWLGSTVTAGGALVWHLFGIKT